VAAGEAAGIKKVVLARGLGEGGADGVATTFSAADTEIWAVITFTGPVAEAKVTAVWTLVESADGRHKNLSLGHRERSGITDDEAAVYAGPFPSTSGEWPPGRYAVEILVNDRLERTAEFQVR
jgi:hypothetical protein